MTQQTSAKLLSIVQERQQIQFEELLTYLPEFTWNQLFSLVDELSRRKLICLRRRGVDYEIRPSTMSA